MIKLGSKVALPLQLYPFKDHHKCQFIKAHIQIARYLWEYSDLRQMLKPKHPYGADGVSYDRNTHE